MTDFMTTNDKNTQRFIVKLENAEFFYALSNIPVRVHVYKRAKLFAFASLPSILPSSHLQLPFPISTHHPVQVIMQIKL